MPIYKESAGTPDRGAGVTHSRGNNLLEQNYEIPPSWPFEAYDTLKNPWYILTHQNFSLQNFLPCPRPLHPPTSRTRPIYGFLFPTLLNDSRYLGNIQGRFKGSDASLHDYMRGHKTA